MIPAMSAALPLALQDAATPDHTHGGQRLVLHAVVRIDTLYLRPHQVDGKGARQRSLGEPTCRRDHFGGDLLFIPDGLQWYARRRSAT